MIIAAALMAPTFHARAAGSTLAWLPRQRRRLIVI
jgi:hypothetical protein